MHWAIPKLWSFKRYVTLRAYISFRRHDNLQLTYSIMSVESHRLLASLQRSPSFVYRCEFSQSNNFSIWWRVCNKFRIQWFITPLFWAILFVCSSPSSRLSTYPLREANDGPHWAAKGAAAAEAAAEQPPNVHRQSLAQRRVHSPDRSFVLLGGDACVQGRRKLPVEAVRQPESRGKEWLMYLSYVISLQDGPCTRVQRFDQGR